MKKHFPCFDFLRFFAFFKVFIFHLPLTNFPGFSFIKRGGGVGVVFFFVLSGFLITYTALEERQRTGRFNMPNFYMRRILRIWPLYYLMVFFAYLTTVLLPLFNIQVSDEGYRPDWLWSLTFLENYKMLLTKDHPNVSPLGVMWSLCIEEHFYIVWGIMLFLVKGRNILRVMILFVLVSLIANAIFILNDISTNELLTNLVFFSFGAIPACLLLYEKEKFKNLVSAIPLTLKYLFTAVVVISTFLLTDIHSSWLGMIMPLVWGGLFSAFIGIAVAGNDFLNIKSTNIISKLGKYTYGLYLYHTIVINAWLLLYRKAGISLNDCFPAISFCLVSFATTIFSSIASYKYFEKPFLRLKRYFY